MLKKCLILLFALLLFLFLLFNNRNFPVSGDSFLGSDVRRFQTTKAWELAKAVEDNDLQEIKHQVIDLKVPVDTRDRINNFTPLMFAVFNNDIQSVKVLLELGADPNLSQDTLFDAGRNAVIIASNYIGVSSKILKLLLEYGEALEDKIIIVTDISQGIVPMDPAQRNWREMVGRTMLYLGGKAEKVIRVFCGLGQEIKG